MYFAVNRRRLARSTSSGSGTPACGGAPAGPESQLAYGSLVFAAGGSLIRLPSSIRARLQHRPAFSVLALKVIDSSMVSVSPDVDREGATCGPDTFFMAVLLSSRTWFSRPERSQPERTRREDRHSKFYEISDNLPDWICRVKWCAANFLLCSPICVATFRVCGSAGVLWLLCLGVELVLSSGLLG